MIINPDFTALENIVLATICEMHPPDRAALKSQLATANVRRRENTGAGFYIHLEVQTGLAPAIQGERIRAGPNAKIGGLQHGMGFILWLKSGYAATLEGYSFGENTSDIHFEEVSFELNPPSVP